MSTDARRIAQAQRSSLIAPAGFGKTHLIAEAVTTHCDGRQLLLTHTHAGVRAMRSRLADMGCPRSRFHVETISGWALRYVAAFPELAGVSHPQPSSSMDWRSVYLGATRLLQTQAISSVVRRSYHGAFVDEYQDCTASQHALVLRIADLIPCRILGDPLQGIFDFERDPIDWKSDVDNNFEPLDELQVPYRWKGRNEALGRWLVDARQRLESGEPICLRRLPPQVIWEEVSPTAQRNACYSSIKQDGTVAAIHEGTKNGPCKFLARSLGGCFQCIEAVDCKELYDWVRKIGEVTGGRRATQLIDFAGSCLTKVKSELATIKKRMQDQKSKTRRLKKHLDILEALERVTKTPSLGPATAALDTIRRVQGAVLFRRELWDAFRRSLVEFESGNYETVADAAWKVRDLTRRVGRPAEKRIVSRTLLIKGLEFDHAIVLDADSLDTKQLYVALTRGSRTLRILSKNPKLQPR